MGGPCQPQFAGWFLGCSISGSGVRGVWMLPFCGFWPRFRLSVVLRARCCGGMGVQCLVGFLFGLLGIFRAVRLFFFQDGAEQGRHVLRSS